MIAWATFFALGVFAGCFVPDGLRQWVRGAAGTARSAVLGARSASAPAANVAIGLAKTAAFVATNPLRALSILGICGLLLAWALLGTGCVRLPFTETREHAQMRADAAQAEIKTRDKLSVRDQELARIAQGVIRVQARLDALTQQGTDAINAATPTDETPLPPLLVSAWRDSINSLRIDDASANGDRRNPSGPSASR